jgi:hypothetical protein
VKYYFTSPITRAGHYINHRIRLVKRGKEMHDPVNPSQIVFVETVGTNSKVAQLIASALNVYVHS